MSEANVNLATERATVTYDPAQTSLADLTSAVEKAGYERRTRSSQPARRAPVSMHATRRNRRDERQATTDAEAEQRARELRHRRDKLLVGVALTLPVVVLSMFFMNRFPGENLLLLALTAPVWGYVGWDFHRTALRVRAPLRREHGRAGQPRLDRRLPDERRRDASCRRSSARPRSTTPPR